MFNQVLLCGMSIAIMMFMGVSKNVSAAEATGHMSAIIMDPLLIDLKEAKRFCRDEPQAVKCDILKERTKEEE